MTESRAIVAVCSLLLGIGVVLAGRTLLAAISVISLSGAIAGIAEVTGT
jgi:hypothetical protein